MKKRLEEEQLLKIEIEKKLPKRNLMSENSRKILDQKKNFK
jgi:hypothetical protein